MPVERESRRPLTSRDRMAIAVVGVIAAAALAAGIDYAVATSDRSNAGCVVVTFPASLGGETIRHCGTAATAFCRAEAAHNPRIADACRRLAETKATTPSSGRAR